MSENKWSRRDKKREKENTYRFKDSSFSKLNKKKSKKRKKK